MFNPIFSSAEKKCYLRVSLFDPRPTPEVPPTDPARLLYQNPLSPSSQDQLILLSSASGSLCTPLHQNKTVNMPKSDAVGEAFSQRFSSLETLLKATNDNVQSVRNEVTSLRSDVTSFKDELQQSVEIIIQEKISDVTATFDQKISEIRKEVDEAVSNSSIRSYLKASEAIHAFETGIFIPNIREQLNKTMNRASFQELAKSIDKSSNYLYASECVSALSNLLSSTHPDDQPDILRSGLFLQDSFVVGTAEAKHLILKFSTAAMASVFREMLLSYNRQSDIDQQSQIRFSRTRTGSPPHRQSHEHC